MENSKDYWKKAMEEQSKNINESLNSYQNKMSDINELSKSVSKTNPNSDYSDFKKTMDNFLNEMSNLEKEMTNYQETMKKNNEDIKNLNSNQR